ncbi:non-ribosomal peptide synthetase [Sclerotinia borealis F-4128]|uniref:Non-ribosomal peptide synthetase n=1 Tax=Sclerotinia borealis (strain F-4128) TaxID=1432307 RepID=W9C657_SCLBF|nr:non-ribosomal peptide synthetase [Sclerotinia borealis F-4128]
MMKMEIYMLRGQWHHVPLHISAHETESWDLSPRDAPTRVPFLPPLGLDSPESTGGTLESPDHQSATDMILWQVPQCPANLMVPSVPLLGFILGMDRGSAMTVPGSITSLVSLEPMIPSELSSTMNDLRESSIECCLHQIVDRQARISPNSVAVDAWDGSLTYGELSRLSSNLANHLKCIGVKPQDFVLIVFEKCTLSIIAITAILKAGAICVPLDPSNASKRLSTVLEDTQAQFAVTSTTYSDICGTATNVQTIAITTELISNLESSDSLRQDATLTTPDDAAFLMYSSGSTGRPKGIIQQHGPMCFSISHHSRAMGITPLSRTLQFSAYTFDTSISDIFGTFMQGAVLCVCSDWDRLNDLARSIRVLDANYICLTPTVAEQLEPNDVPSLRTLCVGGEALSANLVDQWAAKVDLINVYGITECLVWTFTTKPIKPGQFSRSIGHPTCGRAWITDVDDPSQLVKIGEIGELLIEGPNLAREYWNDPVKTSKSFISPPLWLKDLYPNEKLGRVYRSGDLARQAHDGTLEFLGRRDTQVKLNGQRVELGEIEYHMKRILPIGTQAAAHVIHDLVRNRAILVASICLGTHSLDAEIKNDGIPVQTGLSSEKTQAAQDYETNFDGVVNNLRLALSESLPSLLVPTTFVPIQQMPLTVSGKLDRQNLQEMVSNYLKLHPFASHTHSNSNPGMGPATEIEKQLSNLWSSVLGVEVRNISANDEFVRLGGDSAQAMKLVALARKKGLSLTVANILQNQRLSEMAKVTSPIATNLKTTIPSYSLLRASHEVLRAAEEEFGLEQTSIQDAYPCTPLQQGLFALSLRHHGAYVAQTTIELPSTISSSMYMKAWGQVYQSMAILRTRLIETSEGLIQVVIDEDLTWNSAEDYDQYLHDDKSLPMGLGSRLNRFALIYGQNGGSDKLVWSAHHATYDGWSAPLVLQEVNRILMGQNLSSRTNFNNFISYLVRQDAKASELYWKKELLEIEAPTFPTRADASREQGKIQRTELRVELAHRETFTSTTLVRAALAILISKYSNTEDIVFGTVLSGRDAAIDGIDTMIGPTFSTVPIRIQINGQHSIEEFLEQIQKQSLNMMPYEGFGLQNISKLARDTEVACGFQTLLITQPPDDALDLGDIKVTYDEFSDAGTYPLTIDCKFESGTAIFQAFFDSSVLESASVELFLSQLDNIIQQFHSAPLNEDIKNLDLMGPADTALIWNWNSQYPPAIDKRVCEVIGEKCIAYPYKEAVCAWDGNFTYRELDILSSSLAERLTQLGIGSEILVPIAFERSKWVVIAVLAVNKAGGAFVLLNPTHPVDRLQSIVSQANSPVILSSRECLQISQELLSTVLVVDDFFSNPTKLTQIVLEAKEMTVKKSSIQTISKPSDLLYVVFTSGTSGTPKGIMVDNRAFCTYIDSLARMTDAKSTWRGLVSSAYSFDSSLEEMLMPLMLGGTICVPSQHELSNDLTGAMNRMGVHWGVFTPSLARLIDPRELTTLTDLYIGGEQMTDALVQSYGSCVKLTNTYGPSECCPTGCVSSTPELYGGHIGRGVACRTWIVDPNNHERLMPVGCIGELILDGPNVGRGYLNDEDKSRAAFIEAPSWLREKEQTESTNRTPIYARRMYKTGDLARYCSNGTMEYIGRKDQQIKFYGQRIELGEIEHHIQSVLSDSTETIVEVATRTGESDQQMLVAFMVFPETNETIKDLDSDPLHADIRILHLRQELPRRIPPYMLPSLYLRLSKIPLTSSDKIDRRKLKQLVLELTDAEFLAAAGTDTKKRPPETEFQLGLQTLWAEVLKIDKDHIGLDDEFFRMGGDSIRAIRLATLARQRGWSLTVADITRYHSLENMTQRITSLEIVTRAPSPFKMLPKECFRIDVSAEAARYCEVEISAIEDIFPCSHLQRGLMALSLKHPTSYIAKDVFELPDNLDVDRFLDACRHLVHNNSILRTRIVHMHSGFYQVVLKSEFDSSAKLVMESDSMDIQPNEMGLGTSLCSLIVSRGSPEGKNKLFWTIHHSLFDGWSMELFYRQLEDLMQGRPSKPTVPYSLFINHVTNISHDACSEFWTKSLAGPAPVHFPKLPRADYLPQPDKILDRTLVIQQECSPHISISSFVSAAWAIVISRYTECNHMSFGVTSSGRKMNLPGIEAIAGPTFATVPTLIRLNSTETKGNLLRRIHDQSVEQTEYEQFGLENISNVSPEAKEACGFQTLLVVQPIESDDRSEEPPILRDISPNQNINTHPLNLEAQLTTTGLVMKASFDTNLISHFNVSHLLSQFSHVMQQLCSSHDCIVGEISTTSPEDMSQIASWNQDLPRSVEACLHDLVLMKCAQTPTAQALSSWDGNFTYTQLDEYSRSIGLSLQENGVTCGDIVPLLFDKSALAIISMLAVLRTGATCVFLDMVNHPFARMQKICEEVQAKIVVCNKTHRDLAVSLVSRVFSVDTEFLNDNADDKSRTLTSKVTPRDGAFIIFTSGSTGTPKGIVHEHHSLSASYLALGPALNIDSSSRVFQFSAFTFDMCIIETLATLVSGGSVCIPSEEERMNDVEGSFSRLGCNWTFLTPSFARTLKPEKFVGIETLCLGSEPITQCDVNIWKPHVSELMTISGPAETSLCTAGSLSGIQRVPYIGKMIGGLSWIAEISDHTKLAPMGVVGELLVEGPVLAREYLNQPERTANSFVNLPDWLSSIEPKPLRRLYKTGDLVKYNSDGSMQIFGRRDGQVKIRGQRVELEEVEYQVNKALQSKIDSSLEYKCAVDAFSPADDSNLTYLAIFIATKLESTFEIFRKLTSFIIERLQGQLPSYMVPGLLMPLSMIPMTATKKTDRRTLRSIAGAMSKSDLVKYMSTETRIRVPPSTSMEKAVQRLWSKVLRVDIDTISSEDKFIYLGGDSIRAISFVSMAREEGLRVTVADTFRHPVLRNLSKVMEDTARVQTDSHPSVVEYRAVPRLFDLDTFNAICENIPKLSGAEYIDLRPCTSTQNFILTAHSLGQEVFQPYMSFKASSVAGVDIDRLIKAWEKTVARHSILRTVVVESPSDSRAWYQLVLTKYQPEVIRIGEGESSCNEIADLLQESRRHLPACQLIVRESGTESLNCTLHLSHAFIDGGCVDALFEDFASFYAGNSFASEGPQYRDFQHYLLNRPVEDSVEFWSTYTEGLAPCLIPLNGSSQELHDFRSQKITLPSTDTLRQLCINHDVTLSILIQAVWATTLHRYTGTTDIAFGNIVSNRDIELIGVEKIIGPVFGIIPRHLKIEDDASTADLLKICHEDFIRCLPHSNFSYLEYFERKFGCSYDQRDFNTVINYRKFLGSQKGVGGAVSELVLDEVESVDPYAFDILLGVDDDDDGQEVSAQIDYWGSRVSDEQVGELVNVFVAELVSLSLRE